MRRTILLIFFTTTLAACQTLFGVESPETWQKPLIEGSYIALDVRTPKEVKENPAEGSINIPMKKLKDQISNLDKSKKILIFCEVGGRASMAKKILKNKGFSEVINIGGWRDWNKYYKNKP